MWSRGFSSEESSAVFTRAQQLAEGINNATEQFDAYYGLWLGRISRGELVLARRLQRPSVAKLSKQPRSMRQPLPAASWVQPVLPRAISPKR